MPGRILIVVGHPDPARFCRALANAYAQGAKSAGHSVRVIDLAKMDVPLLATMEQFQRGTTPENLKEAAQAIGSAEHFVFIFPLWLGTMPALPKTFLEQVMRPGTAFAQAAEGGGLGRPLLKGRSGCRRSSTASGFEATVWPDSAAAFSIWSALVRCGRPCSVKSRALGPKNARAGSKTCASSARAAPEIRFGFYQFNRAMLG